MLYIDGKNLRSQPHPAATNLPKTPPACAKVRPTDTETVVGVCDGSTAVRKWEALPWDTKS